MKWLEARRDVVTLHAGKAVHGCGHRGHGIFLAMPSLADGLMEQCTKNN